jgi:hypothetical protein
LTFFKWVDQATYPPVDPSTGRFPNDRANRALTLKNVDSSGTAHWAESNLLRFDNGKAYWSEPTDDWVEISGNTSSVVPGQAGALLRRKGVCDSATNKQRLLETFIPLNADERVLAKDNPLMCYRWASFDCNEFPLSLNKDGGPFNICVGVVVDAKKDH